MTLNWIDVKETDEYMGNDRKDSIIKKYKVISVSFSNVFIVLVELLQHWFWEIMKTHERFSFTKQTCPAHISSYTHTHAHTHTPRPRQCGIWLIINKKVQPLNNMFLSITLGIYSWKGTCNCFLLPLTNTHIHLHVHILTHTETHTIPSTRGRQLFNSFSIAAISSSRSITVSAGIYSSLVLIMKMWYCTLKPCGYSWPIDFCSVMVYRRREAASSLILILQVHRGEKTSVFTIWFIWHFPL